MSEGAIDVYATLHLSRGNDEYEIEPFSRSFSISRSSGVFHLSKKMQTFQTDNLVFNSDRLQTRLTSYN